MGIIFAFIAMTVFLLGLYNWARSGASLWQIFRMRRGEKNMTREEKIDADREIKQLEQSADRTIRTSLRVMLWLGAFVWVVLGVTMILDMFGINWMGAVYTRARSYWVAPSMDTQHIQSRNETLRNMGNSFRR